MTNDIATPLIPKNSPNVKIPNKNTARASMLAKIKNLLFSLASIWAVKISLTAAGIIAKLRIGIRCTESENWGKSNSMPEGATNIPSKVSITAITQTSIFILLVSEPLESSGNKYRKMAPGIINKNTII